MTTEPRPTAAATGLPEDGLPDVWEEALVRFDQAWQSGAPPDLEAFLPSDAGAYPVEQLRALLLNLIVIDLENRWRRAPRGPEAAVSSRPLIEEYAARFPWLSVGGKLPADLLGGEYRVRWLWGDRPGREEYIRRFALTEREAVALFTPLEKELAALPLPQTDPRAHSAEEPTVGPYVLLEQIGQGWSSHVFRARHSKMNRLVALKVLRRELIVELGPELIRRFFHEMQALGRVNNPHVVHAYDAGPVGATYYLAMEHVEGVNLQQLVDESGPLPLEQARTYGGQLAEGLRHVHEQGLIHRDIKPSNIFLERKTEGQGQIKILDLGFALLRRTAHAQSGTALTNAGDLLGSADYMAPEQALNPHGMDHRADLYSLGCTLYFLLTGQPPFVGGTLGQKLHRHQQEIPATVKDLRPEVPSDLAAIVTRLLAKRPEDRFQTAGEVAAALTEAELRLSNPTQRPATRGRDIRRWGLLAGISSALLAGSSVAFFWLAPGQLRPEKEITPPAGESKSAPRRLELPCRRALQLDSSINFLPLPDNLIAAAEEWTLEAWFKTSDGGIIFGYQENVCLSRSPGTYVPLLYVGNGGRLHGAVWSNGADGTARSGKHVCLTGPGWLNDRRWHHTALSAGGGHLALYLDGALVGAQDSVAPAHLNMRKNQLGNGWSSGYADGQGGWFPFRGLLGEIRIWHVARSAEQIRAACNRKLTGSEVGLAAYYPADEADDTVLEDHSPKHHHVPLVDEPATRRPRRVSGY